MFTCVKVIDAGVKSVVGTYRPKPPNEIPKGFAKVCQQQFWDEEAMWSQLSDLNTPWYLKDGSDAYIYLNRADNKWWIDGPDGRGVYIAPSRNRGEKLPPLDGFEVITNDYLPLPSIEYMQL
jgi:hypothetical protein